MWFTGRIYDLLIHSGNIWPIIRGWCHAWCHNQGMFDITMTAHFCLNDPCGNLDIENMFPRDGLPWFALIVMAMVLPCSHGKGIYRSVSIGSVLTWVVSMLRSCLVCQYIALPTILVPPTFACSSLHISSRKQFHYLLALHRDFYNSKFPDSVQSTQSVRKLCGLAWELGNREWDYIWSKLFSRMKKSHLHIFTNRPRIKVRRDVIKQMWERDSPRPTRIQEECDTPKQRERYRR